MGRWQTSEESFLTADTVQATLEQSFSMVAPLAFGAKGFFAVGGCPVCRRMLRQLGGLPLASSGQKVLTGCQQKPPSCDNQNCVQTVPNVPREGYRSWLRTTALGEKEGTKTREHPSTNQTLRNTGVGHGGDQEMRTGCLW